jgi:NAD(P)-dependent dehydrogenase (short-subunit alcohol dehydrogenase family)
MKLKGKVALVTGGSRGIGRAVCLRLAKEGATVVVNYSQEADKGFVGSAEKVVKEIQKNGGTAMAFPADVSKKEEVKRMIKEVIKKHKHVDILVANAGICPFEEFLKIDEALLDKVLGVNLKGPFFCAQEVARAMIKQKREGRIIFVSSVSSIFGGELQTHYCATKGGINQLMKSIAITLGKHQITSNAVLPGTVITDINRRELTKNKKLKNYFIKRTPIGRLATPNDIAEAVLYFSLPESSGVSGTTLIVDGGMSINLQ